MRRFGGKCEGNRGNVQHYQRGRRITETRKRKPLSNKCLFCERTYCMYAANFQNNDNCQKFSAKKLTQKMGNKVFTYHKSKPRMWEPEKVCLRKASKVFQRILNKFRI